MATGSTKSWNASHSEQNYKTEVDRRDKRLVRPSTAICGVSNCLRN